MQGEFEYDEDEFSPEVLAEIQRRIATPRDQWITCTLEEFRARVEQEARIIQQNRLNSPLPESVLDRFFADHPEERDDQIQRDASSGLPIAPESPESAS